MTLVCAIDQGTSFTKCYVFNVTNGTLVASESESVAHSSPFPGYIEQDPDIIYQSVLNCLKSCSVQLGERITEVSAIGITNQRETTIAWNAETGEPLYNAIVWCDSRTQQLVESYLKETNNDPLAFSKITGLPLHSYFSALKMRWLIDNVPAVRQAQQHNQLRMGTMDAWLIWKLTQGEHFATDATNASRTLLMNLETCHWDADMLDFFKIDIKDLPEIRASNGYFGTVRIAEDVTDELSSWNGKKIEAVLGDQQAALYAQTSAAGPNEGALKVTYGTGAFLLWSIGQKPVASRKGLITTVAYRMEGSEPIFALEGAVAFAGATMNWLQTQLKIVDSPRDSEERATAAFAKLRETGIDACFLVPAFTGLFCPHWREDARTLLIGCEDSCSRDDIALAGLRASAYQTQDMMEAAAAAMQSVGLQANKKPRRILVDGGLARSNVLCQSVADLTGLVVVRRGASTQSMTALGVAMLAGVSTKLEAGEADERRFEPSINEATRDRMLLCWHEAVRRSFNWIPLAVSPKVRCQCKSVSSSVSIDETRESKDPIPAGDCGNFYSFQLPVFGLAAGLVLGFIASRMAASCPRFGL